jgi:hypothetical protein
VGPNLGGIGYRVAVQRHGTLLTTRKERCPTDGFELLGSAHRGFDSVTSHSITMQDKPSSTRRTFLGDDPTLLTRLTYPPA